PVRPHRCTGCGDHRPRPRRRVRLPHLHYRKAGPMTTVPLAQPHSNTPPALDRPVPRWGGFSIPLFALELRRLLRNRRTVIMMVVLPVAIYFIASASND